MIDFKPIKLIKAATYHGPTELAGFHYFPESKKQQECNQFPLLFSVAATNSAARVREGKCEAETEKKVQDIYDDDQYDIWLFLDIL